MRLLTWNSQDKLTLTDDLNDHVPPYAILSHTWGSDSDEVTLSDLQQGQGQNKAGFAKIRFCGERARRDKIDHFWVDTCCIDKTNHVELSEAITSMFRWYHNAQKCYVYLSDVSIGQSNVNSDVLPVWQSSFLASRWFTRGWTLQELLAPGLVEFFSCEMEPLGTKETLTQQIHEVTTIPFAALRGTPLSQFSIAERIRWTEQRSTKKKEDKAYCLLGIFDVFMPLIYGEGDNALRRLQREINNQFGADVAARLGGVDEVPSKRSYQRRELPIDDDDDDFVERASNFDQVTRVLRPGESRATKRVKTSYDAGTSAPSSGRSYSNIATDTSYTLVMGDCVPHLYQSSRHSSMPASEDNSDALLKSLLFDRIDFRINNVKKALLSTCQWLFHHSDFQKWHQSSRLDQHNGFLWIKGKPGCGKSTLMKAAFEWARKKTSKKCGLSAVIPYFFNARAPASLEKSSLGLYRTVVHHLISSCPPVRILFTEKFTFKDPGQSGENWTEDELQGFLYDAVESNELFELCLFIDALDEAEYEDDVRQMISFLIHLSDRALAAGGSCKVQICLSSRHYPHISIGRGLSLVVEEQLEHSKDIETYIIKRLTCPDDPGRDELRAEILKKSGCIFLWVVLVVEILNKLDDCGSSLSDMRARLDTIPPGLNQLFKEILTKSNDGIEISILLFQWMACRIRPLEPVELWVAIEYSRSLHDSTTVPYTDLSVPSLNRLTRFILNCSRGLVEFVKVAPSQTTVVQFIHEAVREFLLKENGLASIIPALATNLLGDSHETLRIACSRCISINSIPSEYRSYCKASHKNNTAWETFRSGMRLKQPFLDYAISHLFDHAEQAQKHGVPQQAFLATQMEQNGCWLESYRSWWNVLERYGTRKIKANVTLLYFLTEQQHWSLIPVLPDLSNTTNVVCGKYGTALQAASVKGCKWVAQILIENGAKVNAYGGEYGSALQAASYGGHADLVQMLLDQGADVNVGGGAFGNALKAASHGGHTRVVQILLDKRADINAPEGSYGSALQAASERGHKNVVEMLLNGGVDVNAEGGLYGTALQAASYGGHTQVVEMLLNGGADVNTEGGFYGTALQAASVRGSGYAVVVQMLLNRGADVNAEGGRHGSALKAASGYFHKNVVQILLQHGARQE